jgi:hypothetical protein
MIRPATQIFIRKSVTQGHCGTRTEYYAVIKADDLTIFPVPGAGYSSPLSGSLAGVRNWADRVGKALEIEVIDETEGGAS